ncbi:sulfite exporter TauE/SafE family protein [Moraxella bovis]|uniref:sulfite exporter TauE/SafE family protein n=1 Tax=Moraxella bovis TaxID=476 RepID=UPI002225F35C|nr:sulfite exporter TauE/SafE family protein [Moraxella bovis]UYZ80699.1 sulfite exporter TauE/SafE family protein [Moraxella bovis]UZA06725.1 sulfite exporter TauE/SafE family protein [Moraxella bovis]UZA11047.1 sulfite exporter TauE/SafE family protein [Moraxella bovis]
MLSQFDNNDWIIIVFFVLGALLHGVSGFGYPIVGTAIIANFYPLKIAVAMVIVPCIILNLIMLRTGGGIVANIIKYSKEYFWLFVMSFLGGLVGVRLLLLFPDGYLKIFLGLTLIVYIITQYSRFRITFKRDKKTMAVAGFLVGVIGGVTNAIVAFLMIYLIGTDRTKHEMVIVNNMSILITKVIQLFTLTPLIMAFSQKQMTMLGIVIVISMLFVYLGSKMRNRLSQEVFGHVISVVLFVLGVYALWQGIRIL